MYNEKLFLTSQEILEKRFNVDTKGYRPQEVDKFLDMVIRDYDVYDNCTKKLIHENKMLQEENAKLQADNRKLKAIIESANEGDTSRSNYNNIDLLKRISNLEKIVYGRDE